MAPTSRYQAYLLRIWTPPDSSGARAMVTDVVSGESRMFPDLSLLFAWLERTFADSPSD